MHLTFTHARTHLRGTCVPACVYAQYYHIIFIFIYSNLNLYSTLNILKVKGKILYEYVKGKM
jgi:hypothetical protein